MPVGVFGAGIFADDEALDVRSDYKHFLAEEQSDELATNSIARAYGASFDDLAATTAFWLALALTQWKMGRLDARVKTAALRIIDEELDLKKWDGSPSRAKRAAALAQAREKIESPQPPTSRLPKPPVVQLPGWKFGEVIGVRAAPNRLALLHMIAYRRSSRYGVKAPVVSILNWTDGEIPTAEQLEKLNYINWRGPVCGNHLYNLASPKRSPIDSGEFIHLGVSKPVTEREARAPYAGLREGESLSELLEGVLRPYWDNPSLPPHHPGFDKPEALLLFNQQIRR